MEDGVTSTMSYAVEGGPLKNNPQIAERVCTCRSGLAGSLKTAGAVRRYVQRGVRLANIPPATCTRREREAFRFSKFRSTGSGDKLRTTVYFGYQLPYVRAHTTDRPPLTHIHTPEIVSIISSVVRWRYKRARAGGGDVERRKNRYRYRGGNERIERGAVAAVPPLIETLSRGRRTARTRRPPVETR